MSNTIDTGTLGRDLEQFYGTAQYYRWSILFPRFVLTDGTKYLAEAAGAYWLMDAIASHRKSYRNEAFVVAHLKKSPKLWTLTLTDGNDKKLVAQRIPYSDFPLPEIKILVVEQDDLHVLLLPSEY